MKWIRSLVAAAMLATLLTGCWGIREIEHMIYVNTVGVDYKDGKFVLYAQLVSFFNIAKKEAAAQTEQQLISVARADGETFDKAIFNLYATAQQRIAWSHVKTILFSEAALSPERITEVLDVWDRYYEFRYTNWIFATKDPIESIFNAMPAQNISVIYSQLNDPTDIYSQNSDVVPIYLFEFTRSWHEKGETLKIPFLRIANNWTENKRVSPKLEMIGTGFFHNSRYKGYIPRSKTRGLRWLNNKAVRANLFIKQNKKPAVMLVMEKVKAEIKPQVKQGKAEFQVKVTASGNIPQLISDLTEKQLEQLAVQEIKKEISDSYLQGIAKGIDVLNLSEALFRSNPSEWHRLAVKGELPLDKNSLSAIDVKATVFSGGISKIKKD